MLGVIIQNVIYLILLYIISKATAKKLKCDGMFNGITCVLFAYIITNIIMNGIIGNLVIPNGITYAVINSIYLIVILILVETIGKNKNSQ